MAVWQTPQSCPSSRGPLGAATKSAGSTSGLPLGEVQHAFADANLIAVLEALARHPPAVDEGPRAALAIDELVALTRALDRSVGRIDLGILEEVDVRFGRAADQRWALVEDEFLPRERTRQHLQPCV